MKKKCNETKNKISKIIKDNLKTIKGLGKRFKKKKTKYMSLAPSDNIDDDGVYTDALNWAIRSDNITNIALTGNFGSGKSSIIKTFKKRLWHNKESKGFQNILKSLYYRVKFKSLSISLASFIDDDSEKNNYEDSEDLKNKTVNNDLKKQTTSQLQEIEKSILQQMFYSVRGRRIPSSRFKRINHLSNKKIFSIIFSLTIVVSLGVFILKPVLVYKLQDKFIELKNIIWVIFFNEMSQWEEVSKILTLACYILFFMGCVAIIFFIIRYFSYIFKIGKINISNFEIEIDKQKDDSIFNKYLDEIIYFFQVCRHNLVFIEDLDRFNSVAIFTKLRELNTLINNSEQIKRKVIFIYAIKDNMFWENKERTKFFDFIVPVIPVINASNSNVVLMKKLQEIDLANELSEEFIDEIAIFIDDMRILKSVVNEFYIYKEKLKNNNRDGEGEVIPLDDVKMLSIIVYKNLFPKDFSMLQLGEGLISRAFMDKSKFLIPLIRDLDNKIKEVENRLIGVKNELLNDQEELALVFANYIRKYVSTNYYQINSVDIGNRTYSIHDLDWNGVDFSTLNNDTEIKRSNHNGHKLFSLKELNDYFKLPYSFSQRYDAIKLKDEKKRKELYIKIETLKNEREKINSYTLSQLIERYGEESVLSEYICQNPFIVFLLRNGYIDEQHQMYVSYFHKGSLTVSDAGFILNVKYRKSMEPTYKLNNKEKIVEKLNLLDFNSKVALNYDLLDYLLGNVEKNHQEGNVNAEKEELHNQYYDSLLGQLVNDLGSQINFIDSFRKITEHKEMFIKTLCHKYSSIWDYIEALPLFSDEKKNEYLKDIILYADIEDLLKINYSKRISTFIESNFEFLRIFASEDSTTITRVKEVIDELSLKFKVLDIEFKDHVLFEYICDNNFYIISPEILRIILKDKLGYELNDIETKNYSVIMDSEYNPLKNYIKQNLEQYVKDIVIANNRNTKESEDSILDLLNKDTQILSLEMKVKVIQHCDTLITLLDRVDRELWKTVILEQKLIPSWDNILIYYDYVGNIDDLYEYLNTEGNYLALSQAKPNSLKYVEKGLINRLALEIVYCKSITDEALHCLINSIEMENAEFHFEKLSKSKTEILIEGNQILFNVNNYNGIRENHRALLIIFLEKYFNEFLGELSSEQTDSNISELFSLDSYDITTILCSKDITDSQKIQLIKKLNKEFVCEDKNVADLLFTHILNSEVFEINNPLFNSLLEHLRDSSKKISLLILQADYLDEQQIFKSLERIGNQYAKVGKPNKRLKFIENDINIKLFDMLKLKLESSIKVIKRNGAIYVNSKSDKH